MPGGAPSNLAVVKLVAGTNPAAGLEVSQTVPAGKWWLLKAVSISLVQAATQTPFPALTIDDGATVFYQQNCGTAAMNVSTTALNLWGVALPSLGSGASTVRSGALPDGLMLPGGYRIQTVTAGIGANSDYAAPSFFVVEYG